MTHTLIVSVLLVGAIVGMWIHWSILKRLRDHHREIWEELGCPSFPLNSSIATSVRVRKFIRSPECRELGDEVLTRRIALEQRLGLGYATILALVFARIAYEAVTK